MAIEYSDDAKNLTEEQMGQSRIKKRKKLSSEERQEKKNERNKKKESFDKVFKDRERLLVEHVKVVSEYNKLLMAAGKVQKLHDSMNKYFQFAIPALQELRAALVDIEENEDFNGKFPGGPARSSAIELRDDIVSELDRVLDPVTLLTGGEEVDPDVAEVEFDGERMTPGPENVDYEPKTYTHKMMNPDTGEVVDLMGETGEEE